MKSEFCEWLTQMQNIADKDSITIQVNHFDVLALYFKEKKTPQQAFDEYTKNFLHRWNSINPKFTEDQLRGGMKFAWRTYMKKMGADNQSYEYNVSLYETVEEYLKSITNKNQNE